MSVEGLCQVCEAGPATHQCARCASFVCTEHYDTGTGLCTDCAAAVGVTDADE